MRDTSSQRYLHTHLQKRGLGFKVLFEPHGLRRLDGQFLDDLRNSAPVLEQQLLDYRQGLQLSTPIDISEFLLTVAPHLDEFIARLFDIQSALEASQGRTISHNVIMRFKKSFVLRRARRYRGGFSASFQELNQWRTEQLQAAPLAAEDDEYATAVWAEELLTSAEQNHDRIEKLTQW